MKTYTYSLKVRTKYALESSPPYMFKKANVTWLGPPSGILIDYDEIFSIQNILSFQLSGLNDLEDKVRLEWSIRGLGGV